MKKMIKVISLTLIIAVLTNTGIHTIQNQHLSNNASYVAANTTDDDPKPPGS
ncbi:hypothetical protein ACFCYN_11210 [Gottfriedia sp. NPDC056225]|uniref:hypothetical protein n=1 Tax=Gottfriedia sp. NPDC056225 TaxID=3345751 RepID=UPI0035DDCD0E